ncbi:MAG: alpha-L-rhamnosidase N-terminal domain-containing protein [Pseudomonadota bacterium]
MRDSAPFIWTSKQTVFPMAMLSAFSQGEPRTEVENRWFLFRRSFELQEHAESSEIHITVDGRYQLFVNGTRVGRGPARCSPLYQRYDTLDISEHLKVGTNTIAVLIRVFGRDTSWYEKTEGLWQPVFGDGGLWISGSITKPSGTVGLCTDQDWKCIESEAWQNDTPDANHGLGAIEVLDARKIAPKWTEPDFDDVAWDDVQIMEVGGGGPESFFGGLVAKPFPQLVSNKLRPLAEEWIAPEAIKWSAQSARMSGAALEDEIYAETLSPLTSCKVFGLEDMLSGEGAALVQTSNGNGVSILFDFEKLTTIYPVIEIDAAGGEIIDIAVNEKLPDEWDEGGPAANSRITRVPVLGLDAHLSRYVARKGVQRFERFEWQAVKWMQITIRNADAGIKLLKVGGVQTHYDAETRGRFECSDPFLTKLWETGRYTLQLCMHDGWEDCPSREQRQWLGDATVENLVGHAAFGPDITDLNAEYIRKVAESQRPDGLTQMFAPGNHGTNGLLIPDWTLQWILNAGDHLRLTDDLDTIEEIFPAVQKALQWFLRSITETGLVANMPYWHFMDWSGVGRAGEACTLNAQLAGAFKEAAFMAKALEMPRVAETYKAAVNKICDALNARHWDARRGIYVDCVDPVSGEQDTRVSQHANAAMILWGNAPQDRWPSMIDWITDPERITFTPAPPIANEGETLDPETGVVMANTFYSHFVFEALAKAGRLEKVFEFIQDRYGPMIAAGASTLWESFEPTASLCHGFSASPTWQMSARILGVRRSRKGKIVFNPNLLSLKSASGSVPVLEGDVDVSLKREADGFSATIDAPKALEIEIEPPIGFSVTQQAGSEPSENRLKLSFQRVS